MTLDLNEKPKKSIPFSILFSPQYYTKLEEMSQKDGKTFAAIIRLGIDREYKEFLKGRFGYAGTEVVSRKQKKEARSEELSAAWEEFQSLDDEALTRKVRELGYFPLDMPLDMPIEAGSQFWVRHRIYTREDGARMYAEIHWDTIEDRQSYKGDIFTLKELFQELQKKKLI